MTTPPLPSPEHVAALLGTRRTIHDFKPDPIDEALLYEGIELACQAPNHHLTQPWRFTLPGPKAIEGICDLNHALMLEKRSEAQAQVKTQRWRRMPGWLVISCAYSNDNALTRQEDYAACCCAVQNLALYLWSHGVGLKWSTGVVVRQQAFYDLLGLDHDAETVIGLFWYGYPERVPPMRRRGTQIRRTD